MASNDDKYKDPVKEMLEEKARLEKAADEQSEKENEPQADDFNPATLETLTQPIEDLTNLATPQQHKQESIIDPTILETTTSTNITQDKIISANEELADEQKSSEQPSAHPTKPEKETSAEEIEARTGTDIVPTETEANIKKSGSSDIATEKTEDDLEMIARTLIGSKLVKKGLISTDQLEIALKVQRDSKETAMIGSILVEMGFITESALGEVLTESTGIEQFDPKTAIIDPNLVKQIPKDVALRFKAVPILLEGESIYVAITDIYNVLAVDRIQRYFPKRFKIILVHCSEENLSDLIDNYYDYELSTDGILKEMESYAENQEELIKISTEQDGYTNPTVRLIDAFLSDAIRGGASDIHFEPEGSFVRLRYRIDGSLKLIRSFHKDYWQAILVRIKIISDMNIAENRNPQDGRITYNVLGRQVDFRVATQPTIHGDNVVMRILDKKKALLPMDKLGFSEENIKKLQKSLRRPEGVIIVTGPTGSGKTTTLYSILSFINNINVNIMTLEDPVEYQLPMIRQSSIKEGTGMDFVGGIKSLMRQDPDIIFIGEIRDYDTATMALRAAMTGHQVFTSLHTNDAISALPRLVDIGVKPQMLSGAIVACIAQRLARRLCEHCKKLEPATEEECKILGENPKKPPELYKHQGCEKCSNTGYKGRIAISEIILVDEGLDELIAKEATRAEMLHYLRENDFKGMGDDGIDKIRKGMLDMDELIHTIDMTALF